MKGVCQVDASMFTRRDLRTYPLILLNILTPLLIKTAINNYRRKNKLDASFSVLSLLTVQKKSVLFFLNNLRIT